MLDTDKEKITKLVEEGKLEQAIIKMLPHVMKRASNLATGYPHLRADAQGEASYALVKATYRYPDRKNRDAEYIPYIYKTIRFSVINLFNKSAIVFIPTTSRIRNNEDYLKFEEVKEDQAVTDRPTNLDLDMPSLFPKRTLRIFKLRLDGMNIREIAAELSMSRGTVHNEIIKIKTILENYYVGQ